MKLPNTAPQYLQTHALMVVAAQEEGRIYRIADGQVEHLETIEQHLEPLSDDEGFFFSGKHGGGSPKDRTDAPEYLKALRRNLGHELNQRIKKDGIDVLYIFEPEHLKGRVGAELSPHPSLAVHQVRYGNYVQTPLKELIDYITAYIDEHRIDLDTHEYRRDFAKF